jgi:hypothetical protein
MKEWLTFLASIATELHDLFLYTHRAPQIPNPDYEMQLAMRIVRRAADDRARREIAEP